MIYIESLKLPSVDEDNTLSHLNYTHKSAYPFHVLSYRGLFKVQFADITLITGGNGCGKSTLLNIIAQKLSLRRPTPFNHTEYFKEYLSHCRIEISPNALQIPKAINDYGRIITSDEVFDYMIATRLKNDEIDEDRRTMEGEFESMKNGPMPKSIDLDNPQSIKAYTYQSEIKRKTKSRYIKEHLGFNLAENSNGENAFKFFTEALSPYGLYLLDEPENSLSAQRQLDLSDYIASMARYERCQFIISTHSPFLMATPGARLYNLDIHPASVMKWTEVPAVKVYYDFFTRHSEDF